ncbi:MAG: STAS domain-containing protein [Terriglobales bacterium]
MALGLDLHYVKDVSVLRVNGRIVLGDELAQIEQKVTTALKESSELIINLAGVDYVDSSGLGALVRNVTAARAKRKKLALCGLTPNVQKLFAITRVADLFPIYATEEEALAAAGSAPRIPALTSTDREGGAHPVAVTLGPRVLCIDSSLDMLAYMRGVLQGDGFQVLSSSNFPDAQLFLRSAAILVFGPNPVPFADGAPQAANSSTAAPAVSSSVDALRQLAPQLPAVSIRMTEDSVAMATDLRAQVKAAAKDIK